jgi:adenylate kinase family enzyme
VRRVVVLGSGGSGKSWLASELGRRTGLPVVHLDRIFWAPGWVERDTEEARAELREEVARDEWIIEGNFLNRLGAERLERADTVVFLDLPRLTCLRRALWRRLRNEERADLPEGCPESWDPAFYRWIWNYPRADRPEALALLHGVGATVHRLRTRREVDAWLAGATRAG